mmetsp:Transcript_25932/g.59913  ORF Transcript_25932/g.59913 Transcript_25932/m.59913 type:complete len:260 (-) Transcript_25932:1068-1847(-)
MHVMHPVLESGIINKTNLLVCRFLPNRPPRLRRAFFLIPGGSAAPREPTANGCSKKTSEHRSARGRRARARAPERRHGKRGERGEHGQREELRRAEPLRHGPERLRLHGLARLDARRCRGAARLGRGQLAVLPFLLRVGREAPRAERAVTVAAEVVKAVDLGMMLRRQGNDVVPALAQPACLCAADRASVVRGVLLAVAFGGALVEVHALAGELARARDARLGEGTRLPLIDAARGEAPGRILAVWVAAVVMPAVEAAD